MCTFLPKDVAERLAKDCPPGDVNITVEIKTEDGHFQRTVGLDKYIVKCIQKAARAGRL
jgi:hypothetical protein